MNNGHRYLREDTYEDMFGNNLEEYVSNMNLVRWRLQQLAVHHAFYYLFEVFREQ